MRDFWEELGFGIKVVTVGLVLAFIIGGGALAWDKVFSPRFIDNQREQFKHSQTHQDAVVQDFSARCAELAQTTDPVARKAIENVIASRASTEDLNKLEMNADVRKCVDTAIQHLYQPSAVES
jgi:hypothetical protein